MAIKRRPGGIRNIENIENINTVIYFFSGGLWLYP